ncbi:hypothetical protein KFE98_02045 [bacterium SCSIO 12741]|nr:hypothetical protein KFE98_02045 [bacterium SCSIO 12741]
MKTLLTGLLALLFSTALTAQNVELLYADDQYDSITRIEFDEKALTGKEMYVIGKAYYMTEREEVALKWYDKAEAKGFDHPDLDFFRGSAYRFLGKPKEASKYYYRAIAKNPESQKYRSDMALMYYFADELDSAYAIASKAVGLSYQNGAAHFIVANVLDQQKKDAEALVKYYEALEVIDPYDRYYKYCQEFAGNLEIHVNKDTTKAIENYRKLLFYHPKEYKTIERLILCYTGRGQIEKSDSLFDVMRAGYEEEALPSKMMEYAMCRFDEFEIGDQYVSVYQLFKIPEEMLEQQYIFYVYNAEGELDIRIQTEKTIKFSDDGPSHLLCAWKGDTHLNYGFGWPEENIPYAKAKAGVIEVLSKERSPAASSTSNTKSGKSKKKKKKKGKKKE